MKATRILMIILSLAVVASFFLPYVVMTPEEMDYINANKYNKPFESVDMLGEDFANISLFKYAKVYYQGSQEIFRNSSNGTLYAVLFTAVPVLAILILLMALAKRPTLSFIFSALLGGLSYLINWDFLDRRIMPRSELQWSITYYLMYACAGVLIVCSVWLFIAKRKENKRLKESA